MNVVAHGVAGLFGQRVVVSNGACQLEDTVVDGSCGVLKAHKISGDVRGKSLAPDKGTGLVLWLLWTK